MKNYDDLKKLIINLYSMNRNNKSLYDFLLDNFDKGNLSYEDFKDIAYSICRGDINNEDEIKKIISDIRNVIDEVDEKNIDEEVYEECVYCNKCGAENDYDATRCVECDSIILNRNIVFCSKCGTKNFRIAGRCTNCGFIVDDLVALIMKKQLEIKGIITNYIPKEYELILDEYDNNLINHAEAIEKINSIYINEIDKNVRVDKRKTKNTNNFTKDVLQDIDRQMKYPVGKNICYKCGSSNVQFVSVISQEGVNADKYFWGGFFLGDYGRGMALKSGTKSETKIIRKCLNCGNEF